MRKLTTEEFIERAIEVHGNRYDYSKLKFRSVNDQVKIICKIHGKFFQRGTSHLYAKSGCKKCGLDKVHKQKRLSTNVLIKRLKNIYKNIYNYKLIKYSNVMTKIKILCKKHGIFKETPKNLLRGCGCKTCYKNYTNEIKLKNFIKYSNLLPMGLILKLR